MDNVEQLLLTILKGIVANPDDVSVKSTASEDADGEITKISIRVHPSDVGLCIGEAGKNAEALRKVISMYAFRQIARRVHIHVEAPRSYR